MTDEASSKPKASMSSKTADVGETSDYSRFIGRKLPGSEKTPAYDPYASLLPSPIPKKSETTPTAAPSVPTAATADLEHDDFLNIDLSRQKSNRAGGTIDERSLHKLVDIKSSLSTIELTLIALTVTVIVLKVAATELSSQIGAMTNDGDAKRVLDVSVSVGLIAMIIAALQIPRHFTDALIHSNHETMRILQMVGATPELISRCLAGLVIRSMVKAAWKGLLASAILYLIVSELAQWWVPVTRTYFLRDVAEATIGIAAFIVVSYVLLRVKVDKFFTRFSRA